MKAWLLSDGNLGSIHVEEKFVKWVEHLRTDAYTTATWLKRSRSSP